jgi:pimeloyl-ACP methyl ester carboxylesterase
MAIGTLARQSIELACGRVSFLRHGSGPPLLLVHGIPTSARLWEPLLGDLGERFDCIAVDLLGLGRSRPAPGADLASPGQADMLAALLDALGVGEVLLALHDQGGAHGMQLMVRHGERVRAVAFCDVVCFDNWTVPAVEGLMWTARGPAGLLAALGRTRALELPMRALWPLPQTTRRAPLPRALIDDWFWALRGGGEPLEAWRRYVVAQSNRWTLAAVPALRAWRRPALVVWATDDVFLPVGWATRLAEELPQATGPVLLPFAGHFFHPEVPRSAAQVLGEFFASIPPDAAASASASVERATRGAT